MTSKLHIGVIGCGGIAWDAAGRTAARVREVTGAAPHVVSDHRELLSDVERPA